MPAATTGRGVSKYGVQPSAWLKLMGAVSFSIDPRAVAVLVDVLGLEVFVETGTFRGDSVAAVADRFSCVFSIEIDPTLYRSARDRFAERPEIDIRLGRSAEVLAQLRAEGAWARRGALFWLDAHWCESAGADHAGQCPLLDELAAIRAVDETAVIAVDDARLFLAPPPAPHVVQDWPRFDDVMRAVRKCAPRHRIIIFNDVIWVLPARAIEAFETFAIKNGFDWLQAAEKALAYDHLLIQLLEKENEIHRLAAAAAERHHVIDVLSEQEREKAIAQSERIAELERVAEERRFALEKTHAEAKRNVEEFNSLIRTHECRIRELEQVAEERRCLLEKVHRDAERAVADFKAGIELQQRRIKELEQTLEERRCALEKAHADADRGFQEFSATIRLHQTRIVVLEQLAEERRAVLETVHADAERGRQEFIRIIKTHEERNAGLERLLTAVRSDLHQANEVLQRYRVRAEQPNE